MIRPPSLTLTKSGGTEQPVINLTPQAMTLNNTTHLYELSNGSFTEAGMYEIFYYVRDVSGVVSPLKRSVVYKDLSGNGKPAAPVLSEPADGAKTKTVVIFKWQAAADPDNNPVAYDLVIATDSSFSSDKVVYRKEGLATTVAAVDNSVGLKDLTTYYWRVGAVDGYSVTWSVSDHRGGTGSWKNFLDGEDFDGDVDRIMLQVMPREEKRLGGHDRDIISDSRA
jgi:hypothetical protein